MIISLPKKFLVGLLEGYNVENDSDVVCIPMLEASLPYDIEAVVVSNLVGVMDSSLCNVHRLSSLTHSSLLKLKLQSITSLFNPFNIKPTS